MTTQPQPTAFIDAAEDLARLIEARHQARPGTPSPAPAATAKAPTRVLAGIFDDEPAQAPVAVPPPPAPPVEASTVVSLPVSTARPLPRPENPALVDREIADLLRGDLQRLADEGVRRLTPGQLVHQLRGDLLYLRDLGHSWDEIAELFRRRGVVTNGKRLAALAHAKKRGRPRKA